MTRTLDGLESALAVLVLSSPPYSLSCIVARYSDLVVENREIFIPHVFSALAAGDPVRIS